MYLHLIELFDCTVYDIKLVQHVEPLLKGESDHLGLLSLPIAWLVVTLLNPDNWMTFTFPIQEISTITNAYQVVSISNVKLGADN
jgi:hypothetical protein